MAMATPPKLRVAISGAGIGGLTLALVISRFGSSDIHVDLYEAQAAISTVGAGIGMWERTCAVMRSLGIWNDVREKAVAPPLDKTLPMYTFRKADQLPEGTNFLEVIPPANCSLYTLHRADMVDCIKRHIDPAIVTVHCSKRLTTYTATSKNAEITLHFADDTIATADVLIGADGIRSPTRDALFRHLSPPTAIPKPRWTRTLAYRNLLTSSSMHRHISPEHRALKGPVCYVGKGKHIITYPISQGKLVNFIVFVTVEGEGDDYEGKWVEEVGREEVEGIMQGWEGEVQDLLRCVEDVSKWAIHVVEDLPISADRNVAIMGDAVHAMETHLGSGAGAAIDDAYVLGRLLTNSNTTLSCIPAVLKLYESARLGPSKEIARISHEAGQLYESKGDEGGRGLDDVGKAIMEKWAWLWTAESAVDQWNRIKSVINDSA